MYQNFIIPYLYEAQHVSGDTPPIIRSLKLHWQPLVFHTWNVVGRVVGGRYQAHCAWHHPPTTRPTTFHVWKTRGFQCSFRLLMMEGVSPETCWASYKYGMIKFWYIFTSCWIFLYELDCFVSCIVSLFVFCVLSNRFSSLHLPSYCQILRLDVCICEGFVMCGWFW